MEVLVFLIPVALLIVGGFLAAFIWAARNEQFDDLETPSHRIFLEGDSLKGTKHD